MTICNIKIDIPSPAPVKDHADLPSGGVHTTPAITMPKTPWKARISLIDKVNMLLDWGMMEDYDCELEHSTMAKEPSTKADASLPPTVRGASMAIGHFISGKCYRDGGLRGQQSHP